MKGYVGTPGALLSIPYVGKESMTPARPVSEKQTLSGRTYAYLGPRARRQWSVSVTGLRPDEVASLVSAAEGQQRGLRWISPVMQTQNMLTARQSLLAGDLTLTGLGPGAAGVVTAADGTVMPSREVAQGSGSASVQTAVVPGEPVCGTAWAKNGTLTLTFLDAAGATIGAPTTTTNGSTLRRCAVFAAAPANAAWVVLSAAGVDAFARPAVTLTPWVMPWSSGKGCGAVIITGPEESYATAWRDASSPSRTDVSFTLSEVG